MIDEIILNYIIIFLVLEIYEIQWQKAQTIMGMLARMYHHYSKSIFLFLIMHPTFYFAIGFMILSDYNFYATLLFSIKAIDIVMKIVLIKQVFIDKDISPELSLTLLTPFNNLLLYISLIFYPILIYMSIPLS